MWRSQLGLKAKSINSQTSWTLEQKLQVDNQEVRVLMMEKNMTMEVNNEDEAQLQKKKCFPKQRLTNAKTCF